MPLKTIVSGSNPLATDADQFRQALANLADVGPLQLVAPQNTPSAPTGAASGTSGNPNGAYRGKTVLITGWEDSSGNYYVQGFAVSTDSVQFTVINNSINWTNIATGGAGVIGKALYRTVAGGAAGTEKFDQVIWNNTATTVMDNVADASLGTGMPTSASNPAAYGTAIPANVPTTNTTGTLLLDVWRIARAMIDGTGIPGSTMTPTYSSGILTSIAYTGSIAGTVTYTYSSNILQSAAVAITVPWTFSITESYTYSGNELATIIVPSIGGI